MKPGHLDLLKNENVKNDQIKTHYRYSEVVMLIEIIIWRAPRAHKVNQIPHWDWLLERARWNDTARSGLPLLFSAISLIFAEVRAGARKTRKTFVLCARSIIYIYIDNLII